MLGGGFLNSEIYSKQHLNLAPEGSGKRIAPVEAQERPSRGPERPKRGQERLGRGPEEALENPHIFRTTFCTKVVLKMVGFSTNFKGHFFNKGGPSNGG